MPVNQLLQKRQLQLFLRYRNVEGEPSLGGLVEVALWNGGVMSLSIKRTIVDLYNIHF